ncbi:MAG: right-handed parallel beta-helix repeat-containing protein [Planctomycetota bacterium]|nr:right-handed parallel beta-helix repeat-containing protein [Planctomycetota bacterium]
MKLFQKLSLIFACCLLLVSSFSCAPGTRGKSTGKAPVEDRYPEADGAYHVRPGDDLQAAIDAAAGSETKIVKVHEGTYSPSRPGQAFIHLNRKHNGVKLIAVGKVILTAANKQIAIVTSRSYPAIVNHVVYFGHGIGPETSIQGFEITGSNGRMLQDGVQEVDPGLPESLKPTLFFYSDGGAVKIYGDSCPQLLDLKIYKNEVRICGAGVSVDQHGLCSTPVLIRNCQFFENRCPATGSAIDVLQDSKATIENCLFVNNIGNYGMDEIAETFRLSYNSEHGCGALSVFPQSRVEVSRCTFTQNWSGVDDKGTNSVYRDCIFWKNGKSDGSRTGQPFEFDVSESTTVQGCFIFGEIEDLQNTIDRSKNYFGESDPLFDDSFTPKSEKHVKVGYRAEETRD